MARYGVRGAFWDDLAAAGQKHRGVSSTVTFSFMNSGVIHTPEYETYLPYL
jgi:hypothetical protein